MGAGFFELVRVCVGDEPEAVQSAGDGADVLALPVGVRSEAARVNEEIRERAMEMLFEMEAFVPAVILLTAPEPLFAEHRVRAAASTNPDWYRRFCRMYPSARRDANRWKKFKTAPTPETTSPTDRITVSGQSTQRRWDRAAR